MANGFYTLPPSTGFLNPKQVDIQPRGEVEIDWSDAFSDRLVGCWLTNGINRELVTNRNLQFTGTDYTIQGDSFGSRVSFNSLNSTSWLEMSLAESQPYLLGTSDFTWLGIVYVRAAPGEQTLFQIGRGQAGGRRFSIFLNTNERWDGELDDDSVRSDFNFNSILTAGARSVLCVTADRSGLARGYVNGVADGTATISGSSGSIDDANHGVHIGYNQELNVGSRDNISSSGFELNLLWRDRILTDEEVRIITETPYRVMQEKTRSVSFLRPPGFSLFLNEGISVSESSNKQQNLLRIITESVGLSEALSRATALVRIVSESVAISELQNFTRGIIRIVNEQLSLAESTVRNLALVRFINEGISLIESRFRINQLIRVLTESMSFSEASSSFRGITRIISEAVSIGESTNRVRGIIQIVSESVAVSESTRVVRGIVRFINESILVSENLLKSMNLVRFQNEQISIPETNRSSRALIRQINETIAFAESVSSGKLLVVIVNESIAITESFLSAAAQSLVAVTRIVGNFISRTIIRGNKD